MNRSIARLFLVVILLFTILIAWTSRWTVFSATALDNNKLNRLGYYASLKVKRGRILADNGQVLAYSVPAGGGTWKRKYKDGTLFSQAIGYSIPQEDQSAGLEQARNSELSGSYTTGLSSIFGRLSSPTAGDDVYTTLDPKAQALARTLIAEGPEGKEQVGSVVAIVPQTGAVKVMYSNPTYDSSNPFGPCPPNQLNIGCQFNMATQAGLPPGSTFKIVTTTAALDTGKYTPTSPLIDGRSPITVADRPLENDSNESYGEVDLTTALTYSINTVYAQVGENVGAQVLQKYMERFGFYSTPPLDYPADQMNASGEKFYADTCGKNKKPELLPVTNPCVDLGRTAIGQANLAVTPLQMAMVVSTVADGGKLMEPRLTSKVVNQYGQTVENVAPQEYHQVMKPKTASELTSMMTDVVEEGTGTAANLLGVKVAGKTGTASIGQCSHGPVAADGSCPDGQPLDDAWFIGFAPVQDPKIAVAVSLENIPNGYGGTYAAPIAAKVIKTLLAENQ